jgi:hypothetical protein
MVHLLSSFQGERSRCMEVEFGDKKLALVETDRAAETQLPISVINSLR